jgi:DNA-binding transcriptional ArsR family regulator
MNQIVNNLKRPDMKEKWSKLREERMERIYDYLESHKREEHTAYSLSKALSLNLSTVQQLIETLFVDGLVVVENAIENNRVKRIVRVKRANEVTLTELSERNPKLDLLIDKAHAKGLSVWIHRIDGTKYEIPPSLK